MNWQHYLEKFLGALPQVSPLIRLIIPFTLGMIGANLLMAHMNMVVLFILCCVVLAFSFFLLKTSSTFHDSTFGVVAMTLFFLIGMTLYTGKHRSIEREIPQDTTFCQGILTESPKEKAHSWALHLQQEDAHIILYIGKKSAAPLGLHIGDTILASFTHFNPTNTCPDDTFKTYYAHLFHNGICATAYAPHNRWTVKPCHTSPGLLASLKHLQETLHTIYDDHGIDGEAGSIVEAMTIGRKADLSPTTRTAYAHAGVSHVLALSGFHVGIIVLMIQFFFFKPLLSIRWQWVSNLLIIAVLWLYALITGMSPSLIRATLMFTILMLSQSFSRDALSPNSCALAFFIMLCINPFYLYDIGFQLSFIAVASIGILGKRLVAICTTSNRLTHYIWLITIIAIALISSVFTAPLVAHYFGKLTFVSLISNLALFSFVYLLMGASILWWAFLWCDPVNAFLTDLLIWTATCMNRIVETISSLPFATIEWRPGTLTTLLCYAVLLTFTYFFQFIYDTRRTLGSQLSRDARLHDRTKKTPLQASLGRASNAQLAQISEETTCTGQTQARAY